MDGGDDGRQRRAGEGGKGDCLPSIAAVFEVVGWGVG